MGKQLKYTHCSVKFCLRNCGVTFESHVTLDNISCFVYQ